MENDDLKGTLVLVNPELVNDPSYRQGETGKIFKADIEGDNIIVDFGNDVPGLYAADALLVLKDKEDLFRLVERGIGHLSEPDFVGIRGIALILNHGFEDSAIMSMKLCKEHPGIRSNAMESLQDVLDRRQGQQISR